MKQKSRPLLITACALLAAAASLLLPTGLVAALEAGDVRAELPVQARLPDAMYEIPLAAALYLEETAAPDTLAWEEEAAVSLADTLAFVRPLAAAGAVPPVEDLRGKGLAASRAGNYYSLRQTGQDGKVLVDFSVSTGKIIRWSGTPVPGATAAEVLAAYQAYLDLPEAGWETLPSPVRGDSALAWNADTCLYCYAAVDQNAGWLSLGVQSRTPAQMAQLYPEGWEEQP